MVEMGEKELKLPVEVKTDIKVPESELSTLFNQLGLEDYLGAFESEGYKYMDLAQMSMEELKDLIPKKGDRNRLKRFLGTQSSGFAKPVLISLNSNSKTKQQLFKGKFRISLLALAETHAETMSAISMVEAEGPYILELMAKPKLDAMKNNDAFLSHAQKDSADLCRSLYLSLSNIAIENMVRQWARLLE